MKCSLMELDRRPELSWAEKLAYLTYQFYSETQISCPVEHIFTPGFYIREMRIPAHTLFIGRPHRHGHLVMLVEGKVLWIDEHFKKTVTAPFEVKTSVGYQAVFLALTDVVGKTIHPNPTDSKDVEALELEAFHPVQELLKTGETLFKRLETPCQV